MGRIRRVPPVLGTLFHSLPPHVHGNHLASFRWLVVVVIAFAWGRRHVPSLDRSGDAQPPRTRCNHCCLVVRWAPEAARRQKAQEVVRALHPGKGETRALVIEASQTATRGTHMGAVATMKDPITEGSSQGPQEVCAMVRVRDQVMPYGLRRYVTRAHCPALDLPCRQTTELAAPRMRACEAPAGVTVGVRCETYALGRGVVQAWRARHWRVAAPLKSHRRLGKASGQLPAGRDGRHLFRRRRTGRPAPAASRLAGWR